MTLRTKEPHGSAMPDLYERHAEMCKVFSNPLRLMVLDRLRETEMNVADLAAGLGQAVGTTSAHLLMMKRQGILVSRRDGKQIFYRLANPKILRAFDLLREIMREQIARQGDLARQIDDGAARRPVRPAAAKGARR